MPDFQTAWHRTTTRKSASADMPCVLSCMACGVLAIPSDSREAGSSALRGRQDSYHVAGVSEAQAAVAEALVEQPRGFGVAPPWLPEGGDAADMGCQ
jgi:hypothetical protein